MLISIMSSWSMRLFLPPKEAQPKVRQVMEGRQKLTLRFHANARKLTLGSLGTPLDHFSVKETTCT